jgi:hypothetical protein
MKREHVLDVVRKIEAHPERPERTKAFEAALKPMYSAGHLAAMLLDRYAHVPMVAPFRSHIGQAIEAAFLGLYHSAVATLIPAIEGIVREHATQGGRNLESGGRYRVGLELEAMVNHERQAHTDCSASDERVEMIELFDEFVKNSLYIKTDDFAADRELNRHGTVHGIYRDYGNAANFYVLMSVLDLLAFILTFRTSGISMFPPEVTAEARKLGTYYLDLRDFGAKAAPAGARP